MNDKVKETQAQTTAATAETTPKAVQHGKTGGIDTEIGAAVLTSEGEIEDQFDNMPV